MAESYYYVLLAAAIALVVALILTPIVRKIALHYDVVAHPGGRRVHQTPTALMGGAGIFVGFMVSVIVVVALHPQLTFDLQSIGMLIGATLVAIVGLLDDRYELPGWFQACVIVVAACILVAFGTQVKFVTNPFKSGQLIVLGQLSIPLTVLWVLMVTKAVDCMDGLDGLAAGISVIASATLMLLALRFGKGFQLSAVMAAALMGGAIGFLRYNYPPAKIFMGTIGAQFLGYMLASISVAGAFKVAAFVAVAAPILILGVPLFDTTFVVLRRAASGHKIHEADKSHLHHRLVDKGFTHSQTIWLIYALTFLLCGTAYALFSYFK